MVRNKLVILAIFLITVLVAGCATDNLPPDTGSNKNVPVTDYGNGVLTFVECDTGGAANHLSDYLGSHPELKVVGITLGDNHCSYILIVEKVKA